MSKIKAEYIWMDGAEPTQKLRSKTKVMNGPVNSIDDLPLLGFDGSSTNPVSYTHLRAHETGRNLVCRLLLEK